MKLNQFEVFVSSNDGEYLHEYQIETDLDSRTTTCFIPSKAGKNFTIHLRSSRPEDTSAVCYLDGRQQGCSIVHPYASSTRPGVYVKSIDGEELYPFLFSELVLLDDDSLRVDASSVAKLGTIEIQVKRVALEPLLSPTSGVLPKGVGPVHEKSKKLGGHCISFGQSKQCSRSNWYTPIPLYPNEGYWAKFIFQYKPEGLLRAQGIIQDQTAPASSASNPTTLKRSRSAALNEGEDAADAGFSNAAPSSPRKKAKREPQHDDEIIDLTHIAEEPPKLLDPSLRGTVIDLTLDDE